jgi:hypothetical protein
MWTRPQRKGILRLAPRTFQPQPHHFPPRFFPTFSKTVPILQEIYVGPGGSANFCAGKTITGGNNDHEKNRY